jgi:hypothetical protein
VKVNVAAEPMARFRALGTAPVWYADAPTPLSSIAPGLTPNAVCPPELDTVNRTVYTCPRLTSTGSVNHAFRAGGSGVLVRVAVGVPLGVADLVGLGD